MVCVAWQPLPLQHHFCHTHTTVTVIGGTAKQLLGSSTDWCATTIVTPHTRGATSTHTHTWMAKWCGVANVLRLLCASTLAWSLHFATPFVCVTSSAKCVTIHSITPLLFYHTPLLVCVALSSGIHALFVGVDALVLASVPLIWDTPCLPSTTACVCGDGVPALPWPCQPLATFLVCFLVCSSSHCFNLH